MKVDEAIVLMCATNYALGRATYVVGSVVSELKKNWDDFSDGNKETLIKQITEAIETGNAGWDCDVEEWKKILKFAKGRKNE